MPAPPAQPVAAARRTRLYGDEDRSRQGSRHPARATLGTAGRWTPPLPLDEQAILADQQLEMCAFFVSKVEKDLLAFRVLELLSISLEESIGTALALDADHERLPIVDAVCEAIGRGGEQPIGGALEKEERGPRFELRILLEQLAVALLQGTEMFLFLRGELFKDAASTSVACDR